MRGVWRTGLLVVMSVIVTACSPRPPSTSNAPQPGKSDAAEATATIGVIRNPMSETPLEPGSSLTLPGGAPVETAATVKAWSLDGYVFLQVIARYTNAGDGWVDLFAGGCPYTVYNEAGLTTARGSTLYGYPRYLRPGESGFVMAEDMISDGRSPEDFASAKMSCRPGPADPPVADLQTDKLAIRQDGPVVVIRGTVTNKGPEDLRAGIVVGVAMYDARAAFLGLGSTNLLNNLRVGETKDFQIYGPPVNAADVAKMVGYASRIN